MCARARVCVCVCVCVCRHQTLDKLFHNLHSIYGKKLKAYKKDNRKGALAPSVNRYTAIGFLLDIITEGWITKPELRAAWNDVGFYLTGVDMARAVPNKELLPARDANTDEENNFIDMGFLDYTPPAPRARSTAARRDRAGVHEACGGALAVLVPVPVPQAVRRSRDRGAAAHDGQ